MKHYSFSEMSGALFWREFCLQWRTLVDLVIPILFFLFIVALFPLFTTPSASLLHTLAPSVLWFAALLAQLLSLSRIFQQEHEQGSLELFCLSPQPLSWLICLKLMAHMLFHLVPILLLSPIMILLYGLSWDEWLVIFLSLSLGLLILQVLGTCISALLVNTRQASLLLIILVMPLYIPVVLFATTILSAFEQNMSILGPFSLLASIACIACAILPSISAASLRIGVES